MNFKKNTAELTTITRDLKEMASKTGNIYESVAVISKRANQISDELRDELISKINEFASQTDNLEEVFENREQIEISKFYESLPKPTAMAVKELMEDKIYIRKAEDEESEKEETED